VEVGIGGEYDSTNIIPKPTCTGITSLGIDHVTILGDTLENIAWHKGGIYKEGVTALTVEQPSSALEVLRQRAAEKEVLIP
jgi:folylpolyglutamate synthase